MRLTTKLIRENKNIYQYLAIVIFGFLVVKGATIRRPQEGGGLQYLGILIQVCKSQIILSIIL